MLHCPTCGRHYADDLQKCPEDGASLQADATVQTDTQTDPLIGRTLDDKYRLDERLGEGGMGTVYQGTHLLIDRPVAVKVLNPHFVEDEAAQERFRREARAAGRLRHTNAVAVTDFGRTADGLFYIVMELLEGRSLRDVLAREAPLDAARAVSLMLQISAAVAAAHEAQVIHRDLKPGNIFVVQRPHAPAIIKVLDFGIAKLATDAGDGLEQKPLTQTGVMIGTPRYMSPEQCDGADLTPASDVYSLGIILYEMLTGTTPFTGPTPLSVALKHSSELPRAPREFVASIPAELETLVLHALEKKPGQRPPDAGAFRRELYSTAQLLGLEHSGGFSAPTLDSLRDAGVETPSGRLVIDIERLREGRAARPKTTEAQAPTTAEEKAIQTGGARLHDKDAIKDEQAAAGAPSVADEPVVARVKVPFKRKQAIGSLLRQPLVLIALALAALSVLVIITSFWVKSSRSPVAQTMPEDAEATGRYITPTGNAPSLAPPTREPKTAAEFYERGGYYFSVRNYDSAIKDFQTALEMQKEFPSAHNRLGRALLAKGQFVSATDHFRKAVEQKNGNFFAAQYNLGFALQQQGDMENAVKAYDAAIEQRGGVYPDAFYQKGIVLLGLKRDQESAEALRKAIEQNNGKDADAQQALGVALARQKDYQGAEAAFRTAIEQGGGNSPELHYNFGLLYETTNRPAEAVREYETYLKQNPNAMNRSQVEKSIIQLRRRAAGEETK
ncbi:MAG: protein kinase, partial [Pyrinomonadaceae bacterium]|nr:protein kinase [Pyrinomonadaceae bacterium]